MESLGTLDKETFEPPESRIADAASAREIIARLKQAELTRAKRRALADGIYDGNPPVPPDTMRGKGRGGESNVNWREAEGMADDAKTPYYDIVFQSERYAELAIEFGEDAALQASWSSQASDRWTKMLNKWPGYRVNTQVKQFQMCFHGVAHAVWEDGRSPLWKWRGVGDVLVSDDAEADIDELETAVIPRSYLPGKLYKLISKEESATAGGWKVEAVKRAIINAAPDQTRSQWGMTWSFYEDAIRNGDASWDARSKRIFVCDVLQKEFDGKISHFILLDDGSLTDGTEGTGTEKGEFLFKKLRRFERMSQVIRPFFFDIGRTGTWHGVKGLGPKIFDFCRESNSLTNRMITGAKVASGLIVQATTEDAVQKAQPVEVGGGAVVIGPGLQIQQNRMGPDLSSPLLVKRDLQMTLQSNTGQYRARVSAENFEPTLGQAQLNLSKESRLSQSAVDRYCAAEDGEHEEMLRRALLLGEELYERAKKSKETPPEEQPWRERLTPGEQLSLYFYEKCVEDGVPVEAMKCCYFTIRAARPIGYGSAQMRMVLANKMMELLPSMDERARNFGLRFVATAFFGPQTADALYPRYDQSQLADEHAALATLENNALAQGGRVLVTPTQNHVVHLETHFAFAMQSVQEPEANPMQVLMLLHGVGPHTKEHLDRLGADETRKLQFEQMQKVWLALAKMTDQLQQQVEEAMQSASANAAPPAPDPKLIAALAKVQAEAGIKREKVMGDLALRKDRQDFILRLKDLQAAHEARIKNRSAAAETILGSGKSEVGSRNGQPEAAT